MPYTCDHCDKTFMLKSRLIKHMAVHTEAIPLICTICDDVYSTHKYLVTHKNVVLTASTKEPNAKANTIIDFDDLDIRTKRKHTRVLSGTKPYLLKICDNVIKKPKYPDSLTTHLQIFTRETPFFCDMCNRRFLHKEDLENHFAPPYTCSSTKCEALTEYTDFPAHSLGHIAGEPYSCNRCQMEFQDKESLRKHTLVYTGKKKHYFIHTDKVLDKAMALRKLELRSTENIEFSCDACEQTFTNLINLTNHILLHSVVYTKKNRRGIV